MATHSSILAWKISHGCRSLVGYRSWGHDYARKNGLFLLCLFEQGMVTILGEPAENGD